MDRRVVGLKNIKPHGRTALYAAIERSLQLFGEPRPGDTVVIVSNGANTLPPVSGNSLANELIARGIRSFALLMAARGIQQTADEQGLEDMSELTRSTGGNVWIISHLDHSGNVNSSASAMIDIFSVELQPPYLLSFHPPMPISKSAKLKVSTGTKELHLEYPQRLTACLPTAATSHQIITAPQSHAASIACGPWAPVRHGLGIIPSRFRFPSIPSKLVRASC